MKKISTSAILFLLLMNCMADPLTHYPIGQVNHTDVVTGIADSLNNRYELSGTVYGGNFTSSGKLSFFINDGTGAIQVYSAHSYNYTPTEGDSIVVVGTLTQYGGVANCGQLEIKASASTSGDTVYKVGTGALAPPVVLTTLDELHESQLVRVNTLTLSFPADWTNSASGFGVRTTQNVRLYFNKYTTATATVTPGVAAFDAIGLVNQYDTSAPYTAYYTLEVRTPSDIITFNGISEVNANPLRVIAFPNPAGSVLTLSFMSETNSSGTLTITDISGRKLSTESLAVTEGENRKPISLAGLADGLYVARLNAGTKESIVKFTVAK